MWIDVDSIRETMARTVIGIRTSDPSVYEQANEKRKAEKEILEKGIAVCFYCDEEIRYNSDMAIAGFPWESEDMLNWCNNNKGNRHQPKIEMNKDV